MALGELARRAGLREVQARELVDVGLLLPAPGQGGRARFDRVDLEVASRFAALLDRSGLRIRDAAPICRGIRAVSSAEMRLRDRAVAGAPPEEVARISLELQELGDLLHEYLFRRCREHEIEERRTGRPEERA